jgi:hypothetical protein
VSPACAAIGGLRFANPPYELSLLDAQYQWASNFIEYRALELIVVIFTIDE